MTDIFLVCFFGGFFKTVLTVVFYSVRMSFVVSSFSSVMWGQVI